MPKDKSKIDFLLRWRNLKRNGNDRKKRKNLIKRMLSANNKKEKKVPIEFSDELSVCSAPAENNEEQINVDAFDVNALIECNEWEMELTDNNFPDVLSTLKVIDERESMIARLNDWSVRHLVKQGALSDLLNILNEQFPDLKMPRDARTIMATPRSTLISKNGEDSYWHYGLEKSLRNSLINIDHGTEISININFDGLPLFKSSRVEFWPILFNIHEHPEIEPMIAGIYCGKGKRSEMLQ